MKKILIIEDDRGLVELIEPMLINRGFEVVSAFDGEQGLKKFDENNPDLIVLDLMIPKTDGFEVLKKVRQLKPEMPVLVLTVRAKEQDEKAAYAAGASVYMIKPFDSEKLLNKIKELLLS